MNGKFIWAGLGIIGLLGLFTLPQFVSSQTLSKDTFKQQLEMIGSLASEGQLVAEQADRNHLTANFVQVHADKMAETAGQFYSQLNAYTVGSDQSDDVKKIGQLNYQLLLDLKQLSSAQNSSDFSKLGKDFSDIENQAEDLKKNYE